MYQLTRIYCEVFKHSCTVPLRSDIESEYSNIRGTCINVEKGLFLSKDVGIIKSLFTFKDVLQNIRDQVVK